MFLKEHRRYKDGKNHRYYSLCETIRTEEGPRHRTVSYLGELNSDTEHRWRKTIEVVDNKGMRSDLSLFPESAPGVPVDENIATVRLNGIRWERPRDFGEVYVGWMLWKRLGLDTFYSDHIDRLEDKADVSWSLVAAILAINRLCAPRSELFIDETWYKQTALDDILGVAEEKVHKDRLYHCLDLLIKNKEALEKHLKGRYGELFKVTYDILLYDPTSTYFEGQANINPQAKRGHSRDHRPDCKQVLVALIVSEEGFPFAFEVLDGNRRDVTTLKEMLDTVENKYGYARRIWVFDRGVVSEANLKLLRTRKTPYVAGTNRSMLKSFEAELLSSDWEKVKEDVEIYKVPRVSGEELFVLVRSGARREKEKAMREGAMKRVEKRLRGLVKRVSTGRLKDEKKILIQAGQILGRHPSVARLYKTELHQTDKGQHEFQWSTREEKLRWKQMTEGTYLVRTCLTDIALPKLWEIYIQLTEAEAAFRAVKSELSIRPIWHHKEKRTQAHILVAFLGYALWVTLKHSLKGTSFLHEYDYDVSPWKALGILSRIKSGDIILPTTDGRTLRLRRISTPDEEGKQILEKLKISLPGKLRPDQQM